MTEKASLEGCWFTLSKHVGRVLRKIRELLFSENADMSNDNAGEKPAHRKPKVSYATLIGVGLVGH